MSQAALTTVEELAMRLEPKEQLALLERIAENLRAGVRSPPPRDLYGVWREHFGAGFDIDGTLNEIRSEWERKADR